MKRKAQAHILKTFSKAALEKDMPDYINILHRISNETGFHPGISSIERWLELSDTISVVYVDGEPVGFSTAGKLFPNENLIYIAATMVSEKYQNNGFSSKLWMDSFKGSLKTNIRCWLKPVYFTFRTQNPKLYSILQKKIDVFPNLQNKELNDYEKKMVKMAATTVWPNQEFDVSEMIMFNAFKETPEFLPDVTQINWSGNKQVDDFFENKLKLSKKGLDIFMILGKIRFGFMLFFA